MCTSGTTGKPKGAMITEENLVTNLNDISEYFKLSPEDHILIARPLYHCAVLTGEFLISLLKGVKITFFPEEFSPIQVLKNAKANKITVMCGTPTILYHLSLMNLKLNEPLKLGSIVVSGECMTETVAQKLRQAFQNADIYNVYGLTEASPRVAYLPPEDFDAHPLSVGFPPSSVKTVICDHQLLVSGKSVMKGYYNDSIATNQAKKYGWLHTGDIAQKDKAGRLYIKGRKDHMIIRAGMNIYPQEIENALMENEEIQDVLVYGVKSAMISEKIHLQVVTSLCAEEIFDLCRQKLPSYELPDAIEIVDEIPKNASGKVIRPRIEKEP